MRIEEPVDIQATCNTGRRGDRDEDDDEEGKGEDGMIGLGGYGGSYMDDAALPTSSPVHVQHDESLHTARDPACSKAIAPSDYNVASLFGLFKLPF
jgi:hypothetical protein